MYRHWRIAFGKQPLDTGIFLVDFWNLPQIACNSSFPKRRSSMNSNQKRETKMTEPWSGNCKRHFVPCVLGTLLFVPAFQDCCPTVRIFSGSLAGEYHGIWFSHCMEEVDGELPHPPSLRPHLFALSQRKAIEDLVASECIASLCPSIKRQVGQPRPMLLSSTCISVFWKCSVHVFERDELRKAVRFCQSVTFTWLASKFQTCFCLYLAVAYGPRYFLFHSLSCVVLPCAFSLSFWNAAIFRAHIEMKFRGI